MGRDIKNGILQRIIYDLNGSLQRIIYDLMDIIQVLDGLQRISDDITLTEQSYGETEEQKAAFDDFMKSKSKSKKFVITNNNGVRSPNINSSTFKNAPGGNYWVKNNNPVSANTDVQPLRYDVGMRQITKQVCFVYQGDFFYDNGKYYLSIPSANGGPYLIPESFKPSVSNSRDCQMESLHLYLPKSPLNSHGIVFMNLANPNETFDDYVNRCVTQRLAEIEEDKRQQAMREEAEREREEEELRRKQEQEMLAEKDRMQSMERYFHIVEDLRQSNEPHYCKYMENTKRFEYISSSEAPYICFQAEDGQFVVLPNQVDAFNAGMMSQSVYQCNSPIINETSRMTQTCLVDRSYSLIRVGKIK